MTEHRRRACPSCAMVVDAEADVCPVCGYEFPEPKRSVPLVAWLMAALLVLPLLWVLLRVF